MERSRLPYVGVVRIWTLLSCGPLHPLLYTLHTKRPYRQVIIWSSHFHLPPLNASVIWCSQLSYYNLNMCYLMLSRYVDDDEFDYEGIDDNFLKSIEDFIEEDKIAASTTTAHAYQPAGSAMAYTASAAAGRQQGVGLHAAAAGGKGLPAMGAPTSTAQTVAWSASTFGANGLAGANAKPSAGIAHTADHADHSTPRQAHSMPLPPGMNPSTLHSSPSGPLPPVKPPPQSGFGSPNSRPAPLTIHNSTDDIGAGYKGAHASHRPSMASGGRSSEYGEPLSPSAASYVSSTSPHNEANIALRWGRHQDYMQVLVGSQYPCGTLSMNTGTPVVKPPSMKPWASLIAECCIQALEFIAA